MRKLSLLAVVGLMSVLGCRKEEPSPSPPTIAIDETPPSPAPSAPGGGQKTIGVERSRYGNQHKVFSLLSIAPGIPEDVIQPPLFWFTWSNVYEYSHATFAMAEAVATGEPVPPGTMAARYCPGVPVCEIADYVSSQGRASPARALFRRSGTREYPSRDEARQACEKERLALTREWQSLLGKGGGAVVALYLRDGFEDFPESQLSTTPTHLFAMRGVGRDGSLYLADGADRAPIVYKLPADKICEAMTAPFTIALGAPTGIGNSWWTGAFVVAPLATPPTPSPLPSPEPSPRPTASSRPPAPFPSSTTPPTVTTATAPRPSVPGTPGSDPFDLGVYNAPLSYSPTWPLRVRSLKETPSGLDLRIGVAPDTAKAMGQWLNAYERRCNVQPTGANFFRSTCNNVLGTAYGLVGKREWEEIGQLAARFEEARKSNHASREWLLRAVIRFVQSIPYEIIYEDPMGVRAPLSVLSRHAGDCDSKSLLAAVLLANLGWKTAVIESRSRTHAILGVAGSGISGGSHHAEDLDWLMVESTAIWEPGDMRAWNRDLNARNDWHLWPVRRGQD